MKILCVSDQIDPLIYNPNAAENFPDIDLILCAGDLPMDYIDFIVSVFNKPTYFIFGNHNLNEFHHYHGSKVSPALSNMSAATAAATFDYERKTSHNHGAVYAGFRNFCLKEFNYIHPKTGKKTPLLMTGISGSIQYNNGLNQYTDFQMFVKLIKLTPVLLYNKLRYGRYTDIFLTHASPYDIHDHKDPCHIGFKSFVWFLKKFSPEFMIHGHIHLYDQREERIGKYFNTMVVNAFSHIIIEFPNQGKIKAGD